MDAKKIEEFYPLSPMQEGMLFHSLYAPGSGVYCEQTISFLEGSLDVAAFKQAWKRVLERHAVFRTAFIWEDLKEPIQVVCRQISLPLEEQDWRGMSPEKQEERVVAYLRADRARGFELSSAPLMRLALIRVADDGYHIIRSVHHMLLDGWSGSIVNREVFAFYEAFCRGQDMRLEPSRPYKDYIKWLKQQDLSKAENYWRGNLKGFITPTTPGIGQLRIGTSGDTKGYGDQEIELSPLATAALKAFARQNHLTLNTITQGAWAMILARYCGEEDVVFGATVAGRPAALEGVESMVGVLINTLPVRVRVSIDGELLTWLRQLQTQLAQMLQYDYAPLVKVQGWSEVQQGLFENLLVFENYPVNGTFSEHSGSLKVYKSRYLSQNNYPLTLLVVPEPVFTLRLLYDRNRFNDSMATQILGHFQNLLEEFVANPDRQLVELTLLTESERDQILVGWNATEKAYPNDKTLVQLFEEQVVRSPDSMAVEYEGAQLTYRELNARANQLAHHLASLGVGPEVMVGIYMERSLEMVIGIYGIIKAGGAYVPFDPEYPLDRIAFMLEETDVPVLLSQKHLAAGLPEQNANVFCLDSDWHLIAGEITENPVVEIGPDNLAYVIYTSGSTGLPKGVMNEHRGIVNRLLWMQDEYGLNAEDRILQKTPFSFDVSVWEFFWPLLTGAQLVVARPGDHKDPTYLVDLIVERQITTLHFVPSMLQIFLEEDNVGRCTSIRRVICSGEAFPYDLQSRFFEIMDTELHNLYGPTEAAVDVTYWACREDFNRKIVPIGYPVANTRIYILDKELEPVPIGCSGELYIGGIQVARGYLKRPELTADKFIPDPFSNIAKDRLYKTGDLARYLSDGSIEYLGRTDFQVKMRGLRIELGEIEAAVTEISGINQSIVMLREDRPGDQRLVAYLSVEPNTTVSVSVIRGHLSSKLPGYMVPQQFVILDAIPLSPNGKADRKALPKPELERSADASYVAPRNETEKAIVNIWKDLLEINKVGVRDSFFDIGGHSLLLARMLRHLKSCFGNNLTFVDLFQYPTVAALAAFVKSKSITDSSLKKQRNMASKQRAALLRKKRSVGTLRR